MKKGNWSRIRPLTAHPLPEHEAVPAAVRAGLCPHHAVPAELGEQPACLHAQALHQPAAGPRPPRPPAAGPQWQEHRLHPGTVAPGRAFATSAPLGLAASQSPSLLVLSCRCTKAWRTPRRSRSPWTTGGFSALPFGASPPRKGVQVLQEGLCHGVVVSPQMAPKLHPVVGVRLHHGGHRRQR